jgi:hypothetical protein
VLLGRKERLGRPVRRVSRALLVSRVLQDLLVHKDSKAPRVSLARKVNKVHLASLVRLDHKETKVLQVSRVQLGHREVQEPLDLRDLPESRVQLARQDLRVSRVHLASLDRLDPPVPRVSRALQV